MKLFVSYPTTALLLYSCLVLNLCKSTGLLRIKLMLSLVSFEVILPEVGLPYDSWKKPSGLQWRCTANTFWKGVSNRSINFRRVPYL